MRRTPSLVVLVAAVCIALGTVGLVGQSAATLIKVRKPVAIETIEQARQAVTRKKRREMIFSPK